MSKVKITKKDIENKIYEAINELARAAAPEPEETENANSPVGQLLKQIAENEACDGWYGGDAGGDEEYHINTAMDVYYQYLEYGDRAKEVIKYLYYDFLNYDFIAVDGDGIDIENSNHPDIAEAMQKIIEILGLDVRYTYEECIKINAQTLNEAVMQCVKESHEIISTHADREFVTKAKIVDAIKKLLDRCGWYFAGWMSNDPDYFDICVVPMEENGKDISNVATSIANTFGVSPMIKKWYSKKEQDQIDDLRGKHKNKTADSLEDKFSETPTSGRWLIRIPKTGEYKDFVSQAQEWWENEPEGAEKVINEVMGKFKGDILDRLMGRTAAEGQPETWQDVLKGDHVNLLQQKPLPGRGIRIFVRAESHEFGSVDDFQKEKGLEDELNIVLSKTGQKAIFRGRGKTDKSIQIFDII